MWGGRVFFSWKLFFLQIKIDLVLAGYIHRGSESLGSYPWSGQEVVAFRAMWSNLNRWLWGRGGGVKGLEEVGGGVSPTDNVPLLVSNRTPSPLFNPCRESVRQGLPGGVEQELPAKTQLG